MEPTAWDDIYEGAKGDLMGAFGDVADRAEEQQRRLADVLDALGPPGMVAWDPIAGHVELRGHRFRAQQLGSFDGESWLWSWANTHLAIPDDKTALARGFRDRAEDIGVPALRTPMIADDDEELPSLFGGLAIAHGFGEAFYIANQSQVYLIEAGQLASIAARPVGPRRYATVFSHARRTLADVLSHLRGERRLAKLAWVVEGDHATATAPGLSLVLERRDRLRDVLADVKALPHSQELARGAATTFTLDGSLSRGYEGTAFSATYGAWAPVDVTGNGGQVPDEALAVCERLNQLDKLVVFDALLGVFYPRSR